MALTWVGSAGDHDAGGEGAMHQKERNMQEHSDEWAATVNREMAECVLDYIKTALERFGVPRGTFTDDQFDNFVAMYNNRGRLISSLQSRIEAMDGVLVELSNWPNPDKNQQIHAMKIWAASVVDPSKVTMLSPLLDSSSSD